MDNLTAGNPRAHAVRVYYEGSSTIYEGMPVCYNYLTTENWFGGSVSDAGVVSATNTTAESGQNESKYIRVVNPAVVSTSGTGTATAGVIADGAFTGTNIPGIGTYVSVSGTEMTDGVYKVTAVSSGVSITVATGGADVTGTVVSVSVSNLLQFAGVVKKGGWCGKTGPRVLDIYVPNGAIVPVRCDVDTTVGRTVLAVTSAQQELGLCVSNSRPVAIAMETETDLDSVATDITLAKLDPNLFLSTALDGTAVVMAAAGTSNYGALHQSTITSAQTEGFVTNVLLQTESTGDMTAAAGGGGAGLISVLQMGGSYDQTTGTMYIRSLLGITTLTGSTFDNESANITGGHFQIGGACTLTDVGVLSCLWVDSGMAVTGMLSGSASNSNKCLTLIRGTNNGTATMTSFISLYGNTAIIPGQGGVLYAFDFATCSAAADELNACIINGGTGGAEIGITSGGDWKKIRIRIEGSEYWLLAMVEPAEVDMVS